jgi:hypothetical protein
MRTLTLVALVLFVLASELFGQPQTEYLPKKVYKAFRIEVAPVIDGAFDDAVGHDNFARVNSMPVVVNPISSLNCYWPMPFRKRARINFTNDGDKELDLLTYQITYAKMEIPGNAAYFHAQWRKSTVDPSNPDYTILDNVSGPGKYVGTFLA